MAITTTSLKVDCQPFQREKNGNVVTNRRRHNQIFILTLQYRKCLENKMFQPISKMCVCVVFKENCPTLPAVSHVTVTSRHHFVEDSVQN